LRPSRRLVPVLSALLGACTPLGAWVYDAPRFAVAEIHPMAPGGGRQGFEFVLTGCNLNDYDLMADSLALPMRDSARVTVALTVSDEALRQYQDGREVPFTVRSVGTMRTPMGPKVFNASHRGTVQMAADSGARWTATIQNACRPGSSVLPPAEGRGTQLPTVRGPEVAPGSQRPPNRQDPR